MRRAILLLYAGLLVLIPAVAHAQLSSRANRNLETFFVAGSTGLGKAEDGAHTSGDTGVMVLCVRNDTHTNALSGTDGDYTPCATDSTGKVGIRGTYAEDAAHVSADLGLFALAVQNATHTTALSGTDGDYTPLAVDSTGKLGIRGTFAEDAAHTSADLGLQVLTVRQDTAAALAGTDADYQPLITDSTGRLHVNTEMADAAALSDTISGTLSTATVGAAALVYDGASLVRARAINSFSDSTGVGVPSAAIVAQLDNTASVAAVENSYSPLRLSPRRALYTEGMLTAPDPCQSNGVTKSSVAVAVTADAQLIALSGTTIIYVCGFNVSIAGTAPTMRLISGTGSVCATGLTGRTGAYAPLTGSMIASGGIAGTVLATAAGEALCMDTEGTSPSVQGVLTFVQQ